MHGGSSLEASRGSVKPRARLRVHVPPAAGLHAGGHFGLDGSGGRVERPRVVGVDPRYSGIHLHALQVLGCCGVDFAEKRVG